MHYIEHAAKKINGDEHVFSDGFRILFDIRNTENLTTDDLAKKLHKGADRLLCISRKGRLKNSELLKLLICSSSCDSLCRKLATIDGYNEYAIA